jgi:hypothetical protein
MNVYVESNFVLEHALEQEECDSCSEIIQLASQGRITLSIPAFSLAEPHQAIASKAKGRSRLSAELSAQLGGAWQVETSSRYAIDFWSSSNCSDREGSI